MLKRSLKGGWELRGSVNQSRPSRALRTKLPLPMRRRTTTFVANAGTSQAQIFNGLDR
jgi:hypothetical protein